MGRVTYYNHNFSSKKRLKSVGAIFLGFILIIFIGLVYVRHVYLTDLKPVSNSNQNKLVVINSGDSVTEISNILKQDGLIRSTWAFEWYVKNDKYADGELQAGTYNMRPSESVSDIVNQLTYGRIATDLVTILPGQRLDQIEQALLNNGFTKEEVTAALSPNLYIKQYPMLNNLPAGATLEGFLYPDSFDKNSGTSAQTIINESLSEMQAKLTPDIINGFTQNGLNTFQGVTLSSIVEQEVSNLSDKPIVAQVFYSRLKNGMDLGSDVTAYYGSLNAGQGPSLTYDSPYNTLIHSGLPPGPISNVTDKDLEAVAHPASTSYLYFVTGDNGVTYYSQTLAEHDQQASQYCHKLCGD